MQLRAMTSRGKTWSKPDLRYAARTLLVALVYILAARLGLSLAFGTEQVSAVWPPAGIALVVLLTLGYKYWPAIFAGAFVANFMANEPALVALGIAAGNTLEGLAGAWLLRRVAKFREFREPRDALNFAWVAVVATVIAAGIGTTSLVLGGLVSRSEFWNVAQLWWQGDLTGMLLFGPLLLVLLDRRALAVARGRLLEGGLLLTGVFVASMWIFTSPRPGVLSYPFLLFPLVMWIAVRLMQVGVVACMLVVSVVAIWATTAGLGPFIGGVSTDLDLALLQQFVTVLSITSLIVAMAMMQRVAVEQTLLMQANELVRLDDELKEANRRVTNILADILDGDSPRRRPDNERRDR